MTLRDFQKLGILRLFWKGHLESRRPHCSSCTNFCLLLVNFTAITLATLCTCGSVAVKICIGRPYRASPGPACSSKCTLCTNDMKTRLFLWINTIISRIFTAVEKSTIILKRDSYAMHLTHCLTPQTSFTTIKSFNRERNKNEFLFSYNTMMT